MRPECPSHSFKQKSKISKIVKFTISVDYRFFFNLKLWIKIKIVRKKSYSTKVAFILIIIGIFGRVWKNIENRLDNLEIVQIIVLIKLAEILKQIQDGWLKFT